jgi:phosphoadenosine phosphosulfate reductase
MAYFAKGTFAEDPWAAQETLSVPDWLERRETLKAPLALRLDPGFELDTIASDLPHFGLIKISFPKFTDGRGYSMGWLLRTRYQYRGEMRAVGDVLFDEMQFMVRCGFDSFEIVNPATLKLLEDGRRAAAFAHFYQPGLEPELAVGPRPWARRAAPR